ncbi:MAG: hypothetical protein L6R19_24540 [Alphaproteobacteria bacterium]|nr:hypothetical protein [Alphaproteobacteria bacterium]
MTLQYSGSVRDAQLDAVETVVGTSPKLQLRTGAPPADCAAADSGTLLCEITLPSDWMAAASGGSKAKSGTWTGTGAAAGNAGHFRVKNSAGSTTHAQGTVTATGGGGDMTMDNINIALSQAVTVNTFTLAAGNA